MKINNVYHFGSPINFDIVAENIRKASQKYGRLVKKGLIDPPEYLGILIRFKENESTWRYWDVREFLKEAKIKIVKRR